jgi:hypothetical protein
LSVAKGWDLLGGRYGVYSYPTWNFWRNALQACCSALRAGFVGPDITDLLM